MKCKSCLDRKSQPITINDIQTEYIICNYHAISDKKMKDCYLIGHFFFNFFFFHYSFSPSSLFFF